MGPKIGRCKITLQKKGTVEKKPFFKVAKTLVLMTVPAQLERVLKYEV